MKNTTKKYNYLLEYLENNNDEHDFDEHIEAVKNDTYHEHLVGMIYDHLNDEYMLSDSDTGLLKDLFTYYCKHGKDYYDTLPEEYK